MVARETSCWRMVAKEIGCYGGWLLWKTVAKENGVLLLKDTYSYGRRLLRRMVAKESGC